jgi:hypothetical protein
MIIKRIRLKDFCGVESAEVKFATSGVTLIYGPNEIGKSTLMTGIDLLFDQKDDSKREEVRLTKSVNKDVGSEIEADIEIGQFQFTYFKRFHKDRETVLNIHHPKPQSLTGRDAHDRVRQILDASVDISLWKALRILQGGDLEMPVLKDQQALSVALDRAAGQSQTGDKENALFEAAYAEYSKYYTDTGREKEVPLGQAQQKANEAITKAEGLRKDLVSLVSDIDRHATLEKSIFKLKGKLVALEVSKEKAKEKWDAVSRLVENFDLASKEKRFADNESQILQSDLSRRQELVAQTLSNLKKSEKAKLENEDAAVALEIAEQKLKLAKENHDDAIKYLSTCEDEALTRTADHNFLVETFELTRMQERLSHVNIADEDAGTANAFVASTKLTEKLRIKIRNAEVQFKTSVGILNSALPKIAVKALASMSIFVDEQKINLEPGQVKNIVLDKTINATIESVAEIIVEPGASSDELKKEAAEAEEELSRLCKEAGVASADEAEIVWAKLNDAFNTLSNRDRVVKEHLRDLSREKLEKLIQDSKARVDSFTLNRKSTQELPVSIDESNTILSQAIKIFNEAKNAKLGQDAILNEVQDYYTQCRQDHAVSCVTLERELHDSKNSSDALEIARASVSDEKIADNLEKSKAIALKTNEKFEKAKSMLDSEDPESAKSFNETAVSAVASAKAEIDLQDRELIGLRTKLDLIGEKGLAEALDEANRLRFDAEDALKRLLRRAKAAKLLYETFEFERLGSRRAYVAPLKEGIERLGRHVYGPTFFVDVDEQLQVVTRTIGGVTISVRQLSTGAQEQLGLLVRLAAANMVSKEGSIPLVLDDVLGSTDEERLESMSALLRVASKDLQTIILTCSPERYVHVGAQLSVALQKSLSGSTSNLEHSF